MSLNLWYWNDLHFVVVNHYVFHWFFAQPLVSPSLESTFVTPSIPPHPPSFPLPLRKIDLWKYWIIKSLGKLLICKNIKVLIMITISNTWMLNHKNRSWKLFWKLICVEARETFKGRIRIFNKVKYWDIKEVDQHKTDQKVQIKITGGESFPQCTCYAFKILYFFNDNLKSREQVMYWRLFSRKIKTI